MNVKEAADYLTSKGYRCSAGTVRALVKAKKLACYRGPSPRGPMQFPPDELDRFLREGLTTGDGHARPARPAARRVEVPARAAAVDPESVDCDAELADVWGK